MANNQGEVVTKSEGKTTIREAFGKDSSDYCGSKTDERGGGLGGSVDNLSHTLTGATPKQRGK